MNTYWNQTGTHEALASQLQKMIPAEGSVANPKKNKKLEKFRVAVNCYYDLYNNGLCNRAREFAKVFGIASSRYKLINGGFVNSLYVETELAMDRIILEAASEQQLMQHID